MSKLYILQWIICMLLILVSVAGLTASLIVLGSIRYYEPENGSMGLRNAENTINNERFRCE